jgi:hypothetical protein
MPFLFTQRRNYDTSFLPRLLEIMEVIIRFLLTAQEQVGFVLIRLGDLVFPLDKISCLPVLSYSVSSAEPNPDRLADDLSRQNDTFQSVIPLD